MFDELSHIEFKDGCRMWDSGEKINLENIYGLKIPVKGNTQYVSSSDVEISNLCFFDKNMNYLSGLTYNIENKTFTTPLNCSYITLAVSSTFIYFQLEQGSTATEYEEYIEPKVYILNDNSVYEEFMKKEEISYNLKNKQTNNTQGSWKPIQLDDNENFIVFIIKGSNYEDCRTIPKELVKKYSASSPLIIKFNNTIIAQLAWNAGNMVEYIWTSGYTIEHYAY